MEPQKLRIIAPTLEYAEGSTLQPTNPSSMVVAQDVAHPPGDANPFLSLGRSAKVTYSFVDPISGRQKQEQRTLW